MHYIYAFLFVLLISFQSASAFETKAKVAFLYDYSSGTVLFNKNADQAIEPASMTKMMTVYLLFEQLKLGKISLDDTFRVSEKAWRKGGSKMFVEVGKQVRIEDLIRGIVVQSGNDACIVVAEGIAGSETSFAKMMTKKAREIGMKSTTFRNASGWPDPRHKSTARDLATLALHLIEDFPEYYHYFAEDEYVFHNIRQYNRNPILGMVDGADGVKTGYTEAAGYGLTASVIRDNRRLIMVVGGLNSMKQRGSESERLIEWGFREFESYKLFDKNQQISMASVWGGVETHVPLVTNQKVAMSLPVGEADQFEVKIRYTGPVPAPIKQGDQIAILKINHPKIEEVKIPLYAGQSIEEQGFFSKRVSALLYYLEKQVNIQ